MKSMKSNVQYKNKSKTTTAKKNKTKANDISTYISDRHKM